MSAAAVGGVVAFILSVILTDVVRRIALRRGVLDVPTPRSAHTVVRPRGGGAAIVVAVPLGLIAAVTAGGTVDPRYWYSVGIATLLSGIGLADDLYRLDYRPRLLAQIAAAIALIVVVGSAGAVVIPGMAGPVRVDIPAPLAVTVTLLAVVGFTNAFNFMDGIDGIAAAQAAAGALLLAAMQSQSGGDVIAVAIAAAAAGFLVHNRPPASVFLGDVGSQYLGFLLAAVAVTGERVASVPASLVGLVFLPFAVDTTVTLARRLLRGEPWHEPHQHHTYQRLVAGGWSHGRTTALYTVLALASGVLIAAILRSHAVGWLWWIVALATALVVGRQPRARRHVMLRR